MKPNVLHIIDSFEQGGTERQAIQLVRLLKTDGRCNVQLACLNKRGSLLEEAERLGLQEIVEYPLTSFYDRNFVAQVRRLAGFLKKARIDVVHAHDFYTNIFAMTAAALAQVPARIASKRETEGFRSTSQKFIERCSFRLAHRVVANAEAVRNRLIEEGVSAGKVVTLYNGLEMERILPRANSKRDELLADFGLPASSDRLERRFVTIVANLRHEVKDHPTFLRAARIVHQAAPEAGFVLAGEGPLTESLRRLAAGLGIADEVFFTGRCEQVAELLHLSEVCVLSSRAEGFSNSILEYMAAARPVVVTDVGGAREAVTEGESGYLVNAGDYEAMAARILELLQDPVKAQTFGERGRQTIKEKYSCAAQLDRAMRLYEELLAQRRSASALQTTGSFREGSA
jgi:glycosyltransferase involved in cell wall biosynthesis